MKKYSDKLLQKFFASLFISLLIAYFGVALIRFMNGSDTMTNYMMDYSGVYEQIAGWDNQIQLALLIIFVFLNVFILHKLGIYHKGYSDASEHGVHGSARMGVEEELLYQEKTALGKLKEKGRTVSTKHEIKKNPVKTLKSIERGIIVGKSKDKKNFFIVPEDTNLNNRHVLTIGSSGSGKGEGFVKPNLYNNDKETIVVIDPKGELHRDTAQLKRDQGYDVYQIDFANLEGARYNPLDYVFEDKDARSIAQTIASNANKDGKDDFFQNSAKNLLTGLIIYCKGEDDSANMEDVKNLFYRVEANEKLLWALTEQIGETHPAYKFLKGAASLEGKTRASVMGSFDELTSIFSLEKVARLTETSDFNFYDFQNKKSVLYVKLTMKDNPYEAITATFMSQLIDVFYRVADKEPKNTLPIPVIFLLDEFANIGKIDEYPNVASTARGLGISLFTIIQDHAQLEKTYGKESMRTILSNHAIHLYLTTRDQDTVKYYSELSGESTLHHTTNSQSKPASLFGLGGNYSNSESEQYVKRNLITTSDLSNIDRETGYLFMQGHFPYMIERPYQYRYFKGFIDEYENRFRYELFPKLKEDEDKKEPIREHGIPIKRSETTPVRESLTETDEQEFNEIDEPTPVEEEKEQEKEKESPKGVKKERRGKAMATEFIMSVKQQQKQQGEAPSPRPEASEATIEQESNDEPQEQQSSSNPFHKKDEEMSSEEFSQHMRGAAKHPETKQKLKEAEEERKNMETAKELKENETKRNAVIGNLVDEDDEGETVDYKEDTSLVD